TERALRQEQAGELRQALDSWRVVTALRPAADEPRRRVADLGARVAAEAARRYAEGLARLGAGDVDAARRELLLALAADPGHAGALDALKNRLEPHAASHTVAGGEGFADVAKRYYGDEAKAALVARVNDLDPAGRPAAGTVLLIPTLVPAAAKAAAAKRPAAAAEPAEAPDAGYDTEPAAITGEPAPAPAAVPAPAPTPAPAAPPPPDPAEEQLARAAGLMKSRKYEEAAAAAEALAESTAVGARARELAGNAWFAAGDAALKEERYAESIAAYRRAEPARKDAAAAVAAVERRKREKAEESYTAGVRFFINQQLDEAIRAWERTLALNPEHPKAPKDIEKARALQQKLKDIR
ncbi:MAG TPA: hypothetical protein VN317_08575, partial [Candidatus Methanoperedens sp.]|nr:hypothetical protein [Candidatus Methanoperedens sp.]